MYRSRTSTLLTALAIGGASGALTTTAPAVAATPSVVASAHYGGATVDLEERGLGSDRYRLTYTPRAGEPTKVLGVRLPARMSVRDQRVALGLDATGLLTAVVQGPRGLYWAHVTRDSGLHRIPRTEEAEGFGLFKGRVAYVCDGGMAICKASLRTRARRVLLRAPSSAQWIYTDVRIGDRDALAVTGERDGALGASRVQVVRPGSRKARTIAEANLDGNEAVLLRDVSPAADHVNVIQRRYAPDGDPQLTKDTLAVFTFPGGRRVV